MFLSHYMQACDVVFCHSFQSPNNPLSIFMETRSHLYSTVCSHTFSLCTYVDYQVMGSHFTRSWGQWGWDTLVSIPSIAQGRVELPSWVAQLGWPKLIYSWFNWGQEVAQMLKSGSILKCLDRRTFPFIPFHYTWVN